MPLFVAPVVAVAHASGGYIAAKVTSGGLVYIAGTTATTASASLVAGTAAVQTAAAATGAAIVGGVSAAGAGIYAAATSIGWKGLAALAIL